MTSVWLLWFEQATTDSEHMELLIGVYRTEDGAIAALERVKHQPGFQDYTEGFQICEYVLDQDHWTEGFVRV